MTNLIEFTSPAKLDESLAEEISQLLTNEIDSKGYANLAVSGGRTPAGLFELLSTKALEWEKVNITLADERWVKTTSRDSNEKLLKATLLQNNAAKANFISLKQSGDMTEHSLLTIENSLLEQKAFPFDVLTLGMGEDGHTASLFPCSDEIYQAMAESNNALLTTITPKTAPYNRISFTLQALLQSRKVFLHLVGSSKLDVLERARQGDNIMEMPIRAFLQHKELDFSVYWAPR